MHKHFQCALFVGSGFFGWFERCFHKNFLFSSWFFWFWFFLWAARLLGQRLFLLHNKLFSLVRFANSKNKSIKINKTRKMFYLSCILQSRGGHNMSCIRFAILASQGITRSVLKQFFGRIFYFISWDELNTHQGGF